MTSFDEFWLDDPSTKNAFTLELAESIADRVSSMKDKGHELVPSFVLRARGSVFVSGGNLLEHRGSPVLTLKSQVRIRRAIERMRVAPVYKMAFVEGDVLGGGLELLSAFDWVVVRSHVVFEWRQAQMGLSYGWGGGIRLRASRLGSSSEKLCMRSERLSADRAFALGLIDQIVDGNSSPVDQKSLRLPNGRDAYLSQATYLALKTAQSAAQEAKWFQKLWGNPRHRERVGRFKARGI